MRERQALAGPDAAISPPFPSLFTDGGCLDANPSDRGISWAWCRVERGELVAHESGFIEARELPEGKGTNNQGEFFAALRALESLEAGEIVHVYTISSLTLWRYTEPDRAGLKNIPLDWRKRQAIAEAKAIIGDTVTAAWPVTI